MADTLQQAFDDLARAQVRLADAQAELSKDKSALDGYKKTETALKNLISSLEAEIKRLRGILAGHDLDDEERSRLLRELAALEKRLSNAQDKLGDTQTEIAVLNAIIPLDVTELTAAATAFIDALAEVMRHLP